jgi:alkaline phosphatase
VYKLARRVRIDPAHISNVEKKFQRWGTGFVLVGRIMPGIRTLINIPAGLARMSYFTFFLATFIGSYIWCTLLIGVGYLLGHEWVLISAYLKQFLPYLLTGGAIALSFYFWFSRRTLAYVPARLNDE